MGQENTTKLFKKKKEKKRGQINKYEILRY